MESFNSILLALVSKFDVPHLFTLIVLYGGWKFVNRILVVFQEHGSKMAESVGSISEDIRGIRSDLSHVSHKLLAHEERIGSLENKMEK